MALITPAKSPPAKISAASVQDIWGTLPQLGPQGWQNHTMRRGLAGLILGLSLVLASVSWAGFVMTRTVLDPGRSERLAEQVFENEQLRDALSDRLASGLETAIPGDLQVPPELLKAAADKALDDPAVQKLVKDGIVATHRNALEGNSDPLTIDASALGAAVRDSLVSLSPELEAVIPAVPPVEVTLPTGRLSFLGRIRNFVEKVTTICGALALVGAAAALLLTTDRPGVLRRVAMWAFGAAAFWMVVGFGIPWLAGKLAPSSDAIIAAVIDVFFGAMIPPAITMAIVGAVLFGVSLAWSTASARQPAAASPATAAAAPATHQPVQRQPVQRQAQDRRQSAGVSSNIRPPRQGTQPVTGQVPATPAATGQVPAYFPPTGPLADPTTIQPSPDPTVPLQPAPENEPDPWATTGPQPTRPATPEPQWVEGVGYVDPEEAP